MIYVFDDSTGWGKEIAPHCRGTLFREMEQVPAGATAFVRLDQTKDRRAKSREMIQALARRGCHVVPGPVDAQVYDDKIEQIRFLQAWMPRTFVARDVHGAEAALRELPLPFVSKSADGSGSANVRLVESLENARAEIAAAFGEGIPIRYGRVQKGYLLWQELLPENDRDYRVCIIGDHAFGVVRWNRPDVPFASGSGNNYPMTLIASREIQAFDLAWEIVDELRARDLGKSLIAFDFVFDDDGLPRVLEMSGAWTPSVYFKSRVFTREGESTLRSGADMFLMIGELLRAHDDRD